MAISATYAEADAESYYNYLGYGGYYPYYGYVYPVPESVEKENSVVDPKFLPIVQSPKESQEPTVYSADSAPKKVQDNFNPFGTSWLGYQGYAGYAPAYGYGGYNLYHYAGNGYAYSAYPYIASPYYYGYHHYK